MCGREQDNLLDILMIVSEALPPSKTGGLGDVGVALPGAVGLPWSVFTGDGLEFWNNIR